MSVSYTPYSKEVRLLGIGSQLDAISVVEHRKRMNKPRSACLIRTTTTSLRYYLYHQQRGGISKVSISHSNLRAEPV